MGRIGRWSWWFALLVGVPALTNWLYCGSYVVDPTNHRTFWIGPIGTTLPFVVLALVFAVHHEWESRRSKAFIPHSARWGAGAAWLAMMGLTLSLITHPHGPETSSTMAIAVLLTPILYFLLLLIAYPIGALLGAGLMRVGRRSRSAG